MGSSLQSAGVNAQIDSHVMQNYLINTSKVVLFSVSRAFGIGILFRNALYFI
jgi:hypothetical protein